MSAGNPDQKVYVYAVFFFPENNCNCKGIPCRKSLKFGTVILKSIQIDRVAQEPNRSRKPELSEPVFQEPNAELERPEPFPGTETATGFRLNCAQVKRGQTCTFQTCTLFSALILALSTSRLPSMPFFPTPPLYCLHTKVN